jgi:hypothetical protein
MSQSDQAIGFTAHGGHDNHHAMTVRAKPGNLVGYLLDTLDSTYRGTAEFLDYKAHEFL